MAVDDDRTVTITFTETIEYSLDLDFADMAKVLGVNQKTLARIVDDGDDYQPSDTAIKRLRKQGDVSSEDFTVDDITES